MDLSHLVFADEDGCADKDGGSLYRGPSPGPMQPESDTGSVLTRVLEPDELAMYREIVRLDPRFTVLLGRAEGQFLLKSCRHNLDEELNIF